MRGAPQVGFSATIRKIRARTSLLTPLRPPTPLTLEIHVQYKRNPARCQFTTVLGLTKTRGLVHPDQNVLNAIQNSFCRAVSLRRGRCACKASNCRRRARFSRTRSSRELRALTIQPRKCRSHTIMARMLSELYEFSASLSHSFCRCMTFWRGTAEKVAGISRLNGSKSMVKEGGSSCHALLDHHSRRRANHDGATLPFRSAVLLLPPGRAGSRDSSAAAHRKTYPLCLCARKAEGQLQRDGAPLD